MRKFNELSYAELEAILRNNLKLVDMIAEESCREMINLYEMEYLYGLNYHFTWGSLYKNFYFENDPLTIGEHLTEMQNRTYFFIEEDWKVVERWIKLEKRLAAIGWDLSDEDEERLSTRCAQLRDEVEAMIENRMDGDYEWAASIDGVLEFIENHPERFENVIIHEGKIYKEYAA